MPTDPCAALIGPAAIGPGPPAIGYVPGGLSLREGGLERQAARGAHSAGVKDTAGERAGAPDRKTRTVKMPKAASMTSEPIAASGSNAP